MYEILLESLKDFTLEKCNIETKCYFLGGYWYMCYWRALERGRI